MSGRLTTDDIEALIKETLADMRRQRRRADLREAPREMDEVRQRLKKPDAAGPDSGTAGVTP